MFFSCIEEHGYVNSVIKYGLLFHLNRISVSHLHRKQKRLVKTCKTVSIVTV